MINSYNVDPSNPLEITLTSFLYFGGYSSRDIIFKLLKNNGRNRTEVMKIMTQEKLIKKIPVTINDHHIYQVTKKLCVALDEGNSKLFRNKDSNIPLIKNNLRKNFFAATYYKLNPNSFALKKDDKINVLLGIADNMRLSDIPYRYFGSGKGKNKRMIVIEEFIQVLNNKTTIYFIHKEGMDAYYLISLFLIRYIYILSKASNPVIPVMVFYDSYNRQKAQRLLSDENKTVKLSFNFYTKAELDQFFEFNLYLRTMLDNNIINNDFIKTTYAGLTDEIKASNLPAEIDLYLPTRLLPHINTCLIQHQILS